MEEAEGAIRSPVEVEEKGGRMEDEYARALTERSAKVCEGGII